MVMTLAEDADWFVRRAFVETFAGEHAARITPALSRHARGLEGASRLRVIELLGSVGRDQAVPALVEFFRDGGSGQRRSVIRSLRASDSSRAVDALVDIVRDVALPAFSDEALNALADMRCPRVTEPRPERGTFGSIATETSARCAIFVQCRATKPSSFA